MLNNNLSEHEDKKALRTKVQQGCIRAAGQWAEEMLTHIFIHSCITIRLQVPVKLTYELISHVYSSETKALLATRSTRWPNKIAKKHGKMYQLNGPLHCEPGYTGIRCNMFNLPETMATLQNYKGREVDLKDLEREMAGKIFSIVEAVA
ncbi:unnamed protein product [Protopolystoma xenopodis]|uniref:Uncharacterized protein n=1 Tax=Protopolystoma xenopodis TaxID=117903 RepID=A0A3S5CN82_9PLAT|nr:unnamed protein product [Protopolystoma xenopodis]